jgi:hypothetical protein
LLRLSFFISRLKTLELSDCRSTWPFCWYISRLNRSNSISLAFGYSFNSMYRSARVRDG